MKSSSSLLKNQNELVENLYEIPNNNVLKDRILKTDLCLSKVNENFLSWIPLNPTHPYSDLIKQYPKYKYATPIVVKVCNIVLRLES